MPLPLDYDRPEKKSRGVRVNDRVMNILVVSVVVLALIVGLVLLVANICGGVGGLR
jgi:hypothetical protein